MWIWYTDQVPPLPLGFYSEPSPLPGVNSVLLPTGTVSRTLRDVTRFLKRLDDIVPGLGEFLTVFGGD